MVCSDNANFRPKAPQLFSLITIKHNTFPFDTTASLPSETCYRQYEGIPENNVKQFARSNFLYSIKAKLRPLCGSNDGKRLFSCGLIRNIRFDPKQNKYNCFRFL